MMAGLIFSAPSLSPGYVCFEAAAAAAVVAAGPEKDEGETKSWDSSSDQPDLWVGWWVRGSSGVDEAVSWGNLKRESLKGREKLRRVRKRKGLRWASSMGTSWLWMGRDVDGGCCCWRGIGIEGAARLERVPVRKEEETVRFLEDLSYELASVFVLREWPRCVYLEDAVKLLEPPLEPDAIALESGLYSSYSRGNTLPSPMYSRITR